MEVPRCQCQIPFALHGVGSIGRQDDLILDMHPNLWTTACEEVVNPASSDLSVFFVRCASLAGCSWIETVLRGSLVTPQAFAGSFNRRFAGPDWTQTKVEDQAS